MKRFNELNLDQQSKALKFIENELRGFMQSEHIKLYFKDQQNNKQIREHVKKIAKDTVYDINGNVLIKESLEY